MSKERIILTYKDVISGEAEKYIGKHGHFSDYYKALVHGAGDGGVLHNSDPEALDPFVRRSGRDSFQFFSPDPEPKYEYVPFTIEDAPIFRDKWIKINNEFSRVQNYDAECVYLFVHGIVTFISYLDLVLKAKHEDGTPCGKKLEIE